MNQGAIWIIDDDRDDMFMVEEVWKELAIPNELVWFTESSKVIEHLQGDEIAPFLIICDVNLHKIDGFELRQIMLQQPEKKFHTVPFIYWSTYASEQQIIKAYELSAHGFFVKEAEFEAVKDSFVKIIQYWQKSKMPSKKK